MTGPRIAGKKYEPHPNPRPEKIIEHRGRKWTAGQWAELCGKSKAALRGWERRGYLHEELDQGLRKHGLLP